MAVVGKKPGKTKESGREMARKGPSGAATATKSPARKASASAAVKELVRKTPARKPPAETPPPAPKKTAKAAPAKRPSAQAAAKAPPPAAETKRKPSAGKTAPPPSHREDAADATLRAMEPVSTAVLEDVEAKKFEIEGERRPEAAPVGPLPAPRELDRFYGDTKLVLLVRDPEWVFAYWEIGADTRGRFGIPRDAHNKTIVMRWYDVTGLPEPVPARAHRTMDVQINDIAASWYQKMPEANRSWIAELGILDARGKFVPICCSRTVRTPRNGVAPVGQGEEWMHAEELRLRRIFEASGEGRLPAGAASEGAVTSQRLVRRERKTAR